MKLKIHPPILHGIHEALVQIFDQGFYTDKVLEKSFKTHRKWGGRDRRILAESVYEIVRHRLAFSRLAEELKLDTSSSYLPLIFIWLEAFQESFELMDNPLHGEKDKIIKRFAALTDREKASLPLWLDEEMIRQRGVESWASLREPLNQLAPVFLRANLLKGDALLVKSELMKEGFKVTALGVESLVLEERRNVFSAKAFKEGLFEVQDLHSQKVVDILDPLPGEFVIDACAGAGGKTLHISSRMKNKGKVVALDVADHKLRQLKLRARRAGVHNLEIRHIDSSKVVKRLKGKADRLLLDVPCSGLGVLRRSPDTKWKLTLERMRELEEIQSQILTDYASMLKEGGTLVYSTCSLVPSENHSQVKKFLGDHPEFVLEEECELFPGPKSGDGFYIARMKKRL